jgi:hypothetical protein
VPVLAARSFVGGYAAMKQLCERRLRSAVSPSLAICVVQEQQHCSQLPSSARGAVCRVCNSRSIYWVDDTSGEIKRRCSRSHFGYVSMLGPSKSQRQTIDRAAHADGVIANLA